MSDDIVIGVHLGITNSCVAVYQNGEAHAIPNTFGSITTPCYAAFGKGGFCVGQEAKDNALNNPYNTFFGIKRIIGRRYVDDDVMLSKIRWPFEVVNVRGFPAVQLTYDGEVITFTPEEIVAEILKALKADAERLLGTPVKRVVLTIPAYFTDGQRKATILAGQKAGLEVIGVIYESIAAARAYGVQKQAEVESTVLVFDFGGTSLDVTILRANGENTFGILTTESDMHFGGRDFDQKLVEKLVTDFEQVNGPGLSQNGLALFRVRREAKRGKQTLSYMNENKFELQSLHNEKALYTVMTRKQFEEICIDLYPKMLLPVKAALRSAQLTPYEIDQVLMVGGSSKMPKVQEMLTNFFSPEQIRRDINMDEAIAIGAAVMAEFERRKKMAVEDVLRKNTEYSARISGATPDKFVIGIDLGLHKSCAAAYRNGRVCVIPNLVFGSTTSPNYVGYEGGNFIVGEKAQYNALSNPKNTLFEVRNIIGRRYDTDVVAANKAHWPFDVVNKEGFPAFQLTYDGADYVFSPEEITAEIFKDIKRNADDFLSSAVTKAVVTVPVNFVAAQRQATKHAGRIADLDVVIIDEAAAAAMAYSAQCHVSNDFIVVVNFRRLSLTITLLKVVSEFDFRVEASVEDHQLGHDKLLHTIAEKIVLEFEQTHGPGLAQNSAAIARLRREVKKGIRTLSVTNQAYLVIQLFHNNIPLQRDLTREEFAETYSELCIGLRKNINDVLRAANLKPTAIDDVILVGGGCKMPMIQSMLENFFSLQKIRRGINMDEVIAKGAAAFGRYISRVPFPVRIVDRWFYPRGGNPPAPVYFSYSTPTKDGVFRFELDAFRNMSFHFDIHVIPIIKKNIPPAVSFRCKGQKLALRILQAGRRLQRLTGKQEEITLLSLRHPNVVEYLLCGEISVLNLSMVGILIEYCPGGNLNSLVAETVLTEWEICWFLRQVANGLTYLHGTTAHAHGDIRGSKILLTEDRLNCKIGDSWSFYFLGERETDDVNPSSLLHMSPELLFSIFNGLDQTNIFASIGRAFGNPVAIEKQAEVEPANDIWSFGCLALEMFNKGQFQYVSSKGIPLQWDVNNPSRDLPAGLQLLRQVKKGAHPDLSSAGSQHMSAPLENIVKRCLSRKAIDRPVASQLVNAMENLTNRANSTPQPYLIYSTDDADGQSFKLFFQADGIIGHGTDANVIYKIEPTDKNDPQKVTFNYRNYQLALKVLNFGSKLDTVSKTALLSLDHPNIVRYICCGILPIDLHYRCPYPSPPKAVLMEYYPGGNLNTLAEHEDLRDEDILLYLRQIADGLSYLHARQFNSQQQTPIIHGDLKGENIFLSEDRSTCRIGDMENLYLLKEGRTMTAGAPVNQGTLWHMSPELLRHTCNPPVSSEAEKPTGIGRATDIWSFGCVALELLNGGLVPYVSLQNSRIALDYPTPRRNYQSTNQSIRSEYQLLGHVNSGAHPDLSAMRGMNAQVKEMITRCLMHKSDERPNAADLVSALSSADMTKPDITASTSWPSDRHNLL